MLLYRQKNKKINLNNIILFFFFLIYNFLKLLAHKHLGLAQLALCICFVFGQAALPLEYIGIARIEGIEGKAKP